MNRRIIRTVLTVCLVVLTTMQPVSALVLMGTCSGNVCEQKQTCGGCGCCEVAQQEQRCCSCPDRGDGMEGRLAAGHDKLSSKSVGPPPRGCSIDLKASQDAADHLAVNRRCTCRVSVPPMDRTSTSDSAVRDLSLRLASLEFVLPEDVSPIVHSRSVDTTPGSRADFSQRILCVWRI
ncbi:hypothetical protein NZK35_24580 [Stieleria sp. ICT_E10.1]|uniref:hypothetical protein n=1 Tax=Stieleria sedimenti TaxID=2976331 RepID=UPI00217FE380|nr:hypothetical protein [Stieleria sedimenti]MCS7469841.1 hypothetical protein [Stieleria sedimenti]